ncbi:MAG: flagellar motor protein MotD [Candidatus Thiodiazotropha sp. (ex Lucina aurantia)]|uniref:Flagellar motor protein MotD n=1 Tax=Candidatus Thiodiazotropha taylori TaxID=2792791 RepID=A0A9E4TTU7_9GAMM|nr:flagellar motor protein MotD [Candidatus Thiodiazotropha sp. (ex Lucina pensylvanica)]MBT3025012.1 flagellar motor protein MotD [Candidatus Thiodiazotropha taylori]MBT3040806.1 flagellar motor protein MotD [Candidatus Thiodiazotropha sp. (ex Codakia orbicularis)]MBV2103869.1 flagellar motor protein MotD [Candidatus Thiodiazotropha sp. (ex Lucina aurantia)]MCG8093809.1 flagellar motor protein MotD [Candidatus Thiodiazotropha endolucinida]
MSKRRKRKQEHVNHERWIVSYADFITLLFAFFVVMYSISSVNEGKYRVLSQTLTEAFQENSRSVDPIQVGEINRNSGNMAGLDQDNALIQTEQTQGPGTYQDPGLVMDKMPSNETQRLSFLAATIEDMLSDYVDQELVDVSFTEDRVIVNMKDKMLFPSASAHLSREAVNALRSISRVLNTVPNQIQVEGNTDNRPISTKEFPSNWELSAARAASVVHLMTRMGIGAQRLSAVGYAEHRPVADNGTESGRAKNRRVSLIIMGMNGREDRVIDLPTGGQ